MRHYCLSSGIYLGQFETAPENGIEVTSSPEHIKQIWNFSTSSWSSIPDVTGFINSIAFDMNISPEAALYAKGFEDILLNPALAQPFWLKCKASGLLWLTPVVVTLIETYATTYSIPII